MHVSLLCAVALAGCHHDSGAPDAAPPDLIPPPPPAPPSLGQQIDRMGRPAINTALTDPFDTLGNTITSDMAKDRYNAAQDPTMWDSMFHGNGAQHTWLAGNLAIFDGLDATAVPGDGCGTQILADAALGKGGKRYDALASILADDELYVDTSQKTCGLYLGVEARAGLGLPVMDCGGRTPTEDVIDETYTLLSVGASGIGQGVGGFTFAVTDGINADAEGAANATTFPFLGTPN
jgi:hypothetical protein